MRDRRHHTVIALLVASVFLCLVTSCGIPTYIVPNVNITKVSYADNEDTFRIVYSCDDALESSDTVGLLLLYYEGNITSSDDSKITSYFNTNYRLSSNNGVPIRFVEDEPLFSFTNTDGDTASVYGFMVEGSVMNAPSYIVNLTDALDGNASYTIKLSYDEGVVTCSEESGQFSDIELSFHPSFEPETDKNIRIYCAVCISSKTAYSNLYWSQLKNVEYIRLNLD